MTLKRWMTSLVVIAFVGSLAAGCKKEEAKPAEADKAKGAPGAKVEAEASKDKQTAEAPPASARSGFAVFAKDAEILISFNLASLRKSKLWSSYKPVLTKQLYEQAEYKEFMSVCQLDLVDQIDSLMVGGLSNNEDQMVIVVKGLSKQEVTDCGAKITAKDPTFSLKTDGTLQVMTAGADKVHFGWLDDNTLVTAGNVELKDFIATRLAGKDGLDTNAAFMKMLENVDSNATAWFTLVPATGTPVAQGMANFPGGAPVGLFGSVLLEGGLALDVGARFASPDTAKSITDMAMQALPSAKQSAGPFAKYIDKIKVKQQETDVIFQAKLDDAELTELVGMVEKETGGLGNLMGGM